MRDGDFDLGTYRRERLRALEKRVDWLEAYREHLEVSLALALAAAARGSGVDELDLLAVIEPIATGVQTERAARRLRRNLQLMEARA